MERKTNLEFIFHPEKEKECKIQEDKSAFNVAIEKLLDEKKLNGSDYYTLLSHFDFLFCRMIELLEDMKGKI